MLPMTKGKGDDEHDIDDEHDNAVVYNNDEEEAAM
jgi:hypothetical protein